jgi:dUTP pyrophosphatase
MTEESGDFTITPVEYLQAVIDHRNTFSQQEKPLIQAVVNEHADLSAEVARLRAVPTVQFKRLHPDAKIPERMTPGSAGLDLFVCTKGEPLEEWLHIGKRALISTGIAVAIPPGFEGQIRPRSGLAAKRGLTVLNSPGTIDSDFRGEIKVLLVNHGAAAVSIQNGDRIAQLVICPVATPEIVEVDELPGSERGDGGFGSTGR